MRRDHLCSVPLKCSDKLLTEQGNRKLHRPRCALASPLPLGSQPRWASAFTGSLPLCFSRWRIKFIHSFFPPTGDAAYRQRVGGGPSHGHRQHAQKFGKDRTRGSGDIFADKQTDPQTDILVTILRNRSIPRAK